LRPDWRGEESGGRTWPKTGPPVTGPEADGAEALAEPKPGRLWGGDEDSPEIEGEEERDDLDA